MSFPVRLSEITVEWLNRAFVARGLLGARRIVGFEAAPAAGHGGTSSVHVLSLTYDGAEASAPRTVRLSPNSPSPLPSPPGEEEAAADRPNKVLAKFSSESQAVRESAREYNLYQREVAFYAHYGKDPGIPIPACYAAEYDERANTCVLLLEYFEHARSRDDSASALEDVEAAVRCLAPFHARWWGRGGALPFIENEYDSSALEQRVAKVARAVARIKEGEHRGACGAHSLALLETWLAHAPALAKYAQRRPLTMCHGSFHRGQLLFSDRGPGGPWVIDWQNVSANIGALDLARLVVSGLLPEQRRQREREFVALYHALLLEHGVRDYPFEQLLDDYRLGVVSLVVFHSLILADYPVEVITKYWKAKDSFWEVLFHWPGQAAEEWHALGWLRQTVGGAENS